MYEKKQVSKEAFLEIIKACKNGVNWCDGNPGEAIVALVEAGYCGLCLQKKKELKDIFGSEYSFHEIAIAFHNLDEEPVHDYLCKKCEKSVLDECAKLKS